MGKHGKTLQQGLLGRSDANIPFADLRSLLLALVRQVRNAIQRYKLEL